MANTTNFGWETPDDTDLVKDGAAAMRTLGSAIDTSMMDLKGGTSGQILSKNSNTDMDFVWIANDQGDITGVTASAPLTGGGTSGAITVGIQDGTTAQKGAVQLTDSTSSTSTTTAATPNSVKSAYDLADAAIAKSLVDAKGDLLVGSADNTVARLAVGTNNYVLTADSTATNGIKWAAAASGSSTFVGCLAYPSTTVTATGNATTIVTLDSEAYDTDGFHSTSSNTGRMTIPSGKAGYYFISCSVITTTNTTANDLGIYKNGSRIFSHDYTGNGGNEGVFNQGIVNLAVGDYIDMRFYTGAGNKDIYGNDTTSDYTTNLTIQYLGA